MSGVAFLALWAVIGVVCVLYLDLFGRRYDYEKDYKLTRKQIFLAGPVVWYFEFKKRK
jgi:flagellar biosynthesis protein FlhB